MDDLLKKLEQHEAYKNALSLVKNEDEKKQIEAVVSEFLKIGEILIAAHMSGSING